MSARVAALSFPWPELDEHPALAAGEVHLVAARLADDFVCGESRWGLLGEAETRRARRLRFENHRNRWVAGRSLLKELLGRYTGCDAGEVRLRVAQAGKPYLDHPPGRDLFFNYSDSHGALLYAFARGVEVGVDLEKLPRPTRYVALARRKLSDREQSAFARIREPHREEAFLASWTRKEAYGKALGVGIHYPMAEVTLCEDFDDPRYQLRGDHDVAYGMVQLRPPYPGIACIVAAAADFTIRTYRVDVSA